MALFGEALHLSGSRDVAASLDSLFLCLTASRKKNLLLQEESSSF